MGSNRRRGDESEGEVGGDVSIGTISSYQVLESHSGEVWYVEFSHNGNYLASSSIDQSAVIWEINVDREVSLKHRLVGHKKPVISVLWSTDDRQVITCGAEEDIRRWDVESGDCLYLHEKIGVGLVSCEWFPDGKCIIGAMFDRSICIWNLDGIEVENWKDQRALRFSDIALTDDGKWLVSMSKKCVISLFDREDKVERLIQEEDMITSFSLSKDNKYLLVNLTSQKIHLWNIEDDPTFVMSYIGHKRKRFIIRSCFGGYEQCFIASGSEDSQVKSLLIAYKNRTYLPQKSHSGLLLQVHIWDRSTGVLLHVLQGHSKAVNCVSWNPTDLQMLASASDDGTIRIWRLNQVNP